MSHYSDDIVYNSLGQIEDIAFAFRFKCPSCSRDLRKADTRNHAGGVRIKGHTMKQWVYFYCTHCHVETPLWKLYQR